jgi:hypothetical protein
MNRRVFALAAGIAAAAAFGVPAYAQRYDDGGPAWGSWYGEPGGFRRHEARWAVGTFYGRNGANGEQETITIRPDGSAEVRTPDKPPAYGTFAGQTLTIGARISKVEPARGGIVIDGAYYRR